MTNTFETLKGAVLPAVLVVATLLAVFRSPAGAQQFGPWSAPVNLNSFVLSDGTVCPAVVNSPFNDTHPALSKDGLSLFFASTRPGGLGDYDLWVTQRDSLDDCWKTPNNLGPVVNSSSEDLAPNLTTDGHWLFFHSKRPGGCGGGIVRELWATHRQDAGDDFSWETPINLGCTLNPAGADDAGPTFFDDGQGMLYLYINRNLTPANSDGPDIYFSTCVADLDSCNRQQLWSSAAYLPQLSSPVRDTRTAIRRRDGLEIIISSRRPGSLASENLWVSTRASTQDQNWLPPVPINCNWLVSKPCPDWAPAGSLVNSSLFDGGPALSWDGTELYFFRVRPDLASSVSCQDTLTSGPVCRDLYVSKRTKVAKLPN
jgi:hypothetical protein